jgi:hypothetical protein
MYSPQITPFQPSNIDATTKMLMGLQQKGQLQQYVAQRKNDPNLVALALYVSNMSKAQPAVQAEANQPKIVDQAIAGMAPQQMMPEDQGIATLPAQNMQNMAGGGIVAFDEGGEVPRFYDGAFMMPPKIPEGAIVMGNMYKDPDTGEMKYIPGSEPQRSGYEGMTLSDLGGAAKRGLEKLLLNPKEQRRAEIKSKNAEAEQRLGPLMKRYVPMRSDDQQFASEVAKRNNAVDPTATVAPTTPPAVSAPPAASKGPLANLVKQPAAPAKAGIAGLSNTPEAVAAEMEAIQKRQKTENPFAKQIEDLTAAERDALTKEKAQFEADITKAGPAFKDRETRLKTREEKLGKQEESLPYMALMSAGLAIMSGTSPNALTNIGAGSAVGLKSYTAGLDKLTESREKLDDAFGKIEEYRRTEDTMNAKERRSMERAINNTYTEAKKLGLAALQEDWKLDRQDANKQFEVLSGNRKTMFEQDKAMQRTEIEQRGANARTAMQLNAPPAEARMAMMLGTGKTEAERLESGLRKVQDLQSDKTGATYAKLYADHVTEARKQMTEPMTPQEFATSMRSILSAMSPRPPAPLNQPTGQVRQ